MARRASAWGLGFGALMVVAAAAAPVLAQEPQAAEPAPPAAEGTVELPKLTVETQAKKSTKKAAQKKQAPVASAPAPQVQQTSEGNEPRPETATGPVNGYAATRSATGIKTDTPLKEIPQSVSVVGAEQIRDQNAQSLQDALRYVPGVVADGYGLDSRTDTPFIRGAEAADYVDGLRRTFNYYTYNYRIDPYFMERIEVLRGPASVLYGQAPVGGIINSVSKRPEDQQGGEIGVEYGSFDFKQVKFDTTARVTSDGKWSYRLTGVARESETQVDYVDDDRYALAPSITFRPDSNTSITLLGHFQEDRTGSTSQFFPIVGTLIPNVNGRTIPRDRFIGEPTDHYDTDVASGTLIAEHKFNSVFKLSHVSRYADIHNDLDSTYGMGWAGGVYNDPDQEILTRERWIAVTDTQVFNQDTNLEAKFSTGILSHKVLGGVDYSNFQASQGSAAASDQGINVYNPVFGQGLWRGTDCNGKDYDGSPGVGYLPSLEICSYYDQEVTQTGLYLQDQMRL
ncbi:MAG TPA: TonB-dependent receptor plug domain-containing protein, partial [Hyphomicrobium sp.]|nr:TonB-dependent receptor plug domain-containing protein [Hyphomicrobium sp.]